MTASDALNQIIDRAELDGWAGADPYDALLSPLGRAVTPLGPLPRFVLSQAVLRIPAARAIAKSPTSVNTKALGLFLGAVVRGRHLLGTTRPRELARELVDEIGHRGAEAGDGIGWGYPFPWQSRSFWAPAGTPNAVVTATVGWHLLDAAEAFQDEKARILGLAAARFLASGLNHTPVAGSAWALSYTPADRTKVVNVAALAGRLLIRASRRGEPDLAEPGERFLNFAIDAQRNDGSWPYSVDPRGGWEDSFHTGYVLESLVCARDLGIGVPDGVLSRGIEAYRRFFGLNGSARLTASDRAPMDAHSAAQGIITYACIASSPHLALWQQESARESALRIADWSLRLLWVSEGGHFAYRIHRGRRDEREFLRWVQAWMALGMATVETLAPEPATVIERPVLV